MYSTSTKELSISLFMCFRIFYFRQIKMIFRGDENLTKFLFYKCICLKIYSTAPVVFQRPTQASGEGFLAHRNPTRCSVQVPTAGKIFSRRNSTATPPRVNIFTCMTAVGDITAGV